LTVESIMSCRLEKLKPTDNASYAFRLMHSRQIRNLPVVGDDNQFIGLFGIRRLIHLMLPKAAQIKFGLRDLSFMPDELGELHHRLVDIGQTPVIELLEPNKDLVFCKPSTPFPEVLELLDKSADTSLPIIVVDGYGNNKNKKNNKRLVGMVSAWDVLEKIVLNCL